MSRAGKLAGFFILINLIQFFLFVAGNVILFQSRRCGFISGTDRDKYPLFVSREKMWKTERSLRRDT